MSLGGVHIFILFGMYISIIPSMTTPIVDIDHIIYHIHIVMSIMCLV